jgi:wyosine [tRNA(Phe)-imidazoG37] synthetase (radical SAM superfamily)
MKHVFGPVPSRRLGFSLGVDPVVPKTCTMDCIYCELGRTTDRTVERRSYVDPDEVLRELEERLRERPKIDYVTLSGSGEPTLSSDLAFLIGGIRRLTRAPVAVLTNGSLLGDDDVARALRLADVVLPSLDAASQETFRRVNRPHASLDVAGVIRGITSFAERYRGKLWLEMLFVDGVNDSSTEIALLGEAIRAIDPDRVHVNTVVRPGAERDAQPVESSRLAGIARALGPRAEVIAPAAGASQPRGAPDAVERILAMAARRPVTVIDVARAVGINPAEAAKTIASLVDLGLLELVQGTEKQYYRSARSDWGRP